MGAGKMKDDKGTIIEDEYEVEMQNLGERLMFILMSAGILVGVVVVVAVGVISFEKRCLSVVEVEYLGVDFGLVGGNTFDLGRNFVVVVVKMEMEVLEIKVRAIARPVWGCFNERM